MTHIVRLDVSGAVIRRRAASVVAGWLHLHDQGLVLFLPFFGIAIVLNFRARSLEVDPRFARIFRRTLSMSRAAKMWMRQEMTAKAKLQET